MIRLREIRHVHLGGEKMKAANLLFDLDGTVTDPGIGITNSVMYALKKFGIEEHDREKLYKFIGPPLASSFEEYYGFSKLAAVLAVDYYREYYSKQGIFENQLYPGVEQMLSRLQEQGKRLILATSKPEVFAKRILEHFQLDSYFAFVSGSMLDGKRVEKAEVIAYALERCGCGKDAVMIGDRRHDVIGARKNHLDCVGVLFGYGSRQELEEAGAKWLADDVPALERILLA